MLVKTDVHILPWESYEDARKSVREKLHYVRGQWGHKIKKGWQWGRKYENCLTYNGGNDFTLNEDSDSVWIQVDNYVIYIRRNEKAVTAEIINPDSLDKLDAIDIAVGYWNGNKKSSEAIESEFADDDGFSPSPTRIDQLKASAKTSVEAVAVVFNAILATSTAKDIDRWMREEFASGTASIFDKAMDAARQKMQEFGGDHRLFDGSHDLIGAWQAVASAKPEDTLIQESGSYLTAVWKDVVTPMGLPLKTLNREQFEAFAQTMGETLGVNREWLMDAASFTATEGAGAIVGALAVVLNWKETDVQRFSALVGSFGLAAIVAANPFLGVVAVVALAKSFEEARYRKEYGSLAKGALKGGAGTGAFLGAASLVGGPAWVGLTVGVVCAVLAQKGYEKGEEVFRDVSWPDVAKFVTGYFKSWSSKKIGNYGG